MITIFLMHLLSIQKSVLSHETSSWENFDSRQKSCKIELTLKKSAVKEKALDENGSDRVNFKSIEVGQILEGTVSKVESYGVFVKLLQSGNPGISGLCHISEATDKFVKNLGKLFKVGDLVKTKVIKKNIKDKKLSLSLKPSNFDDSTSKAKDLNRTFESSDDSDSDDESASKDDKEVSATRAGDQIRIYQMMNLRMTQKILQRAIQRKMKR